MDDPALSNEDAGVFLDKDGRYSDGIIESIASEASIDYTKETHDSGHTLQDITERRYEKNEDSDLESTQYAPLSPFSHITTSSSASCCASDDLLESIMERQKVKRNVLNQENDGENLTPTEVNVDPPVTPDFSPAESPYVRYPSILPKFLNPQLSDSASAARKRRRSVSAEDSRPKITEPEWDAGVGQDQDISAEKWTLKDITPPHVLSLKELIAQLEYEVEEVRSAIFPTDPCLHTN